MPFAIVQRPSSSWNPILERPAGSAPDATLNLAVNDDVSTSPMLHNQPLALHQQRYFLLPCDVRAYAPILTLDSPVPGLQVICKDVVVVRDLTELPPSEPEQQNLFVLSEDPLLLHLLISTASSFSISLGQCIKMDGLQSQLIFCMISWVVPCLVGIGDHGKCASGSRPSACLPVPLLHRFCDFRA